MWSIENSFETEILSGVLWGQNNFHNNNNNVICSFQYIICIDGLKATVVKQLTS